MTGRVPGGNSLAGTTFGVIGVGNIIAAVAHRAHTLGMTVLDTDVETFPDDLVADIDIERVGTDELLKRSDVISLNCALTEATRELIGADELAKLGTEGYHINTARGQLIDQEALVDALTSRTIVGAALDVSQRNPSSRSIHWQTWTRSSSVHATSRIRRKR
ncbi:2-hydroxyacid dehydrogenase [Natrinema sp. H-ect4]|uniref:2-hydroxyacid dehydrogenase n=1 Tax=Natrinema sp. H-ect4 TaxID=3242699 RepID=UPI0035A90E26